ncbi:MAG: hypothetical protein K6F82_06250 [Sphaerochaetaceae bacterium]|nr:hypothetical protein [Sphaerochaetaceae bacterium]
MRKILVSVLVFISLFSVFSESNKTYDGTYLMNETDDEGNSYTYTYLNGLLLFTTIVDAQGNITTEYYLRDPSDFSLIAVKTDNSVLFKESEQPYKGNFTTDENDNIIYVESDSVYTYSVSGLLLKEEREDTVIQYEYDENSVLTGKTTINGNKEYREYYTGEKVTSYEEYENSLLKESGVYSTDGLIKTVYNRGRAVAKITYGPDLIKILKIEYL